MAVAEKAPKVIDVKAAEAPWYRRWLPLIGLAVIVLYCLLPFYWMIVSALRRPTDQFDNSIIPRHWSLTNFADVFKSGTGFGRGLLNSLIVAGTVTILTLVIGM